jgi:hypothetical protein
MDGSGGPYVLGADGNKYFVASMDAGEPTTVLSGSETLWVSGNGLSPFPTQVLHLDHSFSWMEQYTFYSTPDCSGDKLVFVSTNQGWVGGEQYPGLADANHAFDIDGKVYRFLPTNQTVSSEKSMLIAAGGYDDYPHQVSEDTCVAQEPASEAWQRIQYDKQSDADKAWRTFEQYLADQQANLSTPALIFQVVQTIPLQSERIHY